MDSPKVFVSYSWSSPDYEQRVLELATELVRSGVEVILDKWDLKEGNDAIFFMEKMVTDPSIKKVMMICDKLYAEKADLRKDGTGTEAQIISKKIYDETDQNKFVAVVVEKDENDKPYLPTYYNNRIYIDLSSDADYTKNFEQLLRWIFDKRLYEKPDLGNPPAFLNYNKSNIFNTAVLYSRVVDSIKNHKENRYGMITEYLDIIINDFEKLRIKYKEEDVENYDDLVIESITNFIPIRNELIEIFKLMSLYGFDDVILDQIHNFFESVTPFLDKPENAQSHREWDYDNYKFIVQELFLYFIGILLKNEKFLIISKLLLKRYYSGDQDYGESIMLHFSKFRNYLSSMEHRNVRLKSGRLSLKADILKDRAQSVGINFNYIMQADFILFIRGLFDSLQYDEKFYWFPDTLLYTSHWPRAFEIFTKSESTSYFDNLKIIFNIKSKEDFKKIFELLKNNDRLLPKWQFESINIYKLINYDRLCMFS